jgi:hypothetical protein
MFGNPHVPEPIEYHIKIMELRCVVHLVEKTTEEYKEVLFDNPHEFVFFQQRSLLLSVINIVFAAFASS